LTPEGSGTCAAVNWGPGAAPSTDTVSCSESIALRLDLDGVGLLGYQGVRSGVALDDDGDLNDDLLAATHDQ